MTMSLIQGETELIQIDLGKLKIFLEIPKIS